MVKYIIFLVILLTGCSADNKSDLPIKSKLPEVSLQDFNNNEFQFSDLKGKVIVLSYIYTNCPDICHMTSSKLNSFKKSLPGKSRDDIYFVSISFDPERDTPEILREHARMMNLNLDNWIFLTGSKDNINKVLEAAGIDPWVERSPGVEGYTFSHRDRISIVDRDGQIRMHYKGTNFDEQELSTDIKSLL